jgi:hypothetical protein
MSRVSDLATLSNELKELLSDEAFQGFRNLVSNTYGGGWHTNRVHYWTEASGVLDYTFDDADGEWHDLPNGVSQDINAQAGDIMHPWANEGDSFEANVTMTIDRQGTEDDALDFRIVTVLPQYTGEHPNTVSVNGTAVSDVQSVATGSSGDVAVDLTFAISALAAADVSEGLAIFRIQYRTSNTGDDWRAKSDVSNAEDPIVWKVRRVKATPPSIFIGFDGQSENNTPLGNSVGLAVARELRSRGYNVTTRTFAASGTTIAERVSGATKQMYLDLVDDEEHDIYIIVNRGGYSDIAGGLSGFLTGLSLAGQSLTAITAKGGWISVFVGPERYLLGLNPYNANNAAFVAEADFYQTTIDNVEGSNVTKSITPVSWFEAPTSLKTHPDGLHMNDYGIGVFAENFVNELETLL